MHKLLLEKKEDTSLPIREFGKLLQVAQEQADVSEDELVRSSFRNAELEMLLADEKLQADDANAQHERELSESHADLEMAIYELQQEKNRCAQKNLQIEDLKAQVAVLKTGGASFGSREEARCHISALEAEELAFRIAELEVLLEEQRNETNMLRDLLKNVPQTQMFEEEPADIEQQHNFLPEYLLASCPSPNKEEETSDIEQEGDLFLPEYLLASCPSPNKEEERADIEQEGDLFLPEYLLASCPSPSKEEQTAEIEQHDDSFLPEYLLTSRPSPNKEEQIADIEQQGITLPVSKPHEDCLEDHSDIAPFLEELLINSRSPLRADSVSALDQESQDILRLSELLSSAASLESSCDGSQLHLPDLKMANPQASVKEETQAPDGLKCGGLLQSILEEAQRILSLSASSAVTPGNGKTEPIKVQRGQVVKTPLPTGKTYWTTVEPLHDSCCYTTTYISSNKDITVYQQL